MDFRPLGGALITDFQAVNRLPDHKPPEFRPVRGQHSSSTCRISTTARELGFYFLNYTSRLPVVSTQTGTQAGIGNGFGAANAVGGAAQALAAGLPFAGRRRDGRRGRPAARPHNTAAT